MKKVLFQVKTPENTFVIFADGTVEGFGDHALVFNYLHFFEVQAVLDYQEKQSLIQAARSSI